MLACTFPRIGCFEIVSNYLFTHAPIAKHTMLL